MTSLNWSVWDSPWLFVVGWVLGWVGLGLLLLSYRKQIYIKSIELQIIDKTSAYFLIPLNNTNYLENIKELGLTSILFNEVAEFSIPKSDSELIKKAANCFFTLVKDNIWPPVKKL